MTVEATSASLPRPRTAVTDRAGMYRFPSVPPGVYRIQASLTGFSAVERTATVSLDANTTVDLTIRLSAEAQVDVSGEAPLIDHTSTTTGTNYTASVITRLPVARNYADIVRANPGVSTDRGATQGRSLTLTIYGATSAENQWIIDGVNTTNVVGGVQGKAINNEFVQEVEVKTGGYPAEYGGALGGVINVVTKSGGNEFHGDAFIYFDSAGTAAEQEFQTGDSTLTQMRVDDGQRFDYGADLGGFLLKDRLWFFAAYNRVTLGGHLSRFVASTYVPTDAKFPFDSTNNLYSGKLTWNIASSTTLVGSVFADPSTTSGAAAADPRQGLGAFDVTPPTSLDPTTWYSERAQGGTDFGLRLAQLFGSGVLVTLQGSYHQDSNSLTAANLVQYVDNTCKDGTPEVPCIPPPEPTVSGGFGFIGGLGQHEASTREQAAGSVVLYEGDHEIKAGGVYMDGATSAFGFYTGEQQVTIQNEYGQLYYAHQFHAVSPENLTPVPSRHRYARVLDYGLYLQDSWKVTPGLTVNLGLRWDGEETRNYSGRTVLRFTDAWQPRLGIVWDPWRDGVTKIYAFAGRFGYALPTVAVAAAYGDFTDVTTYNFDRVSVAQDDVLHHETPDFNSQGAFGDMVDAGVRAAYQDELTLGVERLITPNLTVGLKGTYRSLGNALEDRCDFEYYCAFINPGSGARYASGDAPACNGLDPEWSECYLRGPASPAAKRIYRGVEFLARQALGNRLWFQASYVYSSLRGNFDGGVNEAAYGQTTPSFNTDYDYPALWHNAYGTLTLDRPNRFRFDGYWVTPWQLSVGLQAFVESGAPLNKFGFFNSGYGSLVFLVPRGSVGRLPTLWGADLTLSYPIVIGPATVTLQAYLFNIFNKQIADSRDDTWSIYLPQGFPDTIYDPNQQQNYTEYGKVNHRSDPRVFRAAVKVSF